MANEITVETTSLVRSQMRELSDKLAKLVQGVDALPIEEQPAVREFFKKVSTAIEEIEKSNKRKLLLWLNVNGAPIPSSKTGSVEGTLEGYAIQARKSNPTVDMAALQNLMEQRKLPWKQYFKVVYEPHEHTLELIKHDGLVSELDIQACSTVREPALHVKRKKGNSDE